ncbi:TPA: hypothetical protein ACF1TJ_002751 [Enterococcus hirae]
MKDAALLEKVFSLVSNFTLVGGGLWLIWGTVILAGALKDKNGPQLQQGSDNMLIYQLFKSVLPHIYHNL